MIAFTQRFLESGAKSAASSRPRKTTSRKNNPAAKPDEGVQDSVPVTAEQSVSQAAADFQEEPVPMAQHDMINQEWQTTSQGVPQASDAYAAEAHYGHENPDQDGYYEDDGYAQPSEQVGQNQIVLTLSYSLMNQVRQVARMEGVFPEDILIELIAEGVTRRAFEDAQRPAPSHLMTRTGYVAPDANGNVQQPQLSHHGMQGNHRGNHQGQNNNRRFHQNNNRGNHFQGRNRQNQFKNKQRSGK